MDILYGKLINAVRNNKEYRIKFCDDCKTARISLGSKELNPIIASTVKLLNSNSVKHTNIDLQNKAARYFVISLTQSKGHKLLTISKPKQNTKTSIQIRDNSTNAFQVRIVQEIGKEKMLIYDTGAAYYSSCGKYYPATVASCCYKMSAANTP